jgi:hypothetical protein
LFECAQSLIAQCSCLGGDDRVIFLVDLLEEVDTELFVAKLGSRRRKDDTDTPFACFVVAWVELVGSDEVD